MKLILRQIILLPILVLASYGVFAQVEYNYTPITRVGVNKTVLKSELTARMEQLQSQSYKYKKESIKLYSDTYNNVISAIDSNNFYFDDTLYVFFQNILKNIQAANPELKRPEIHLFVSRSTYPNAYCDAGGNLVFNIGLLRYIDNESQAAFVICHELAHFARKHVYTSFEENLDKLYSKETQADLRKIKSESGGSVSKTFDLWKNYAASLRQHSRMHESEADSLAYVFLSRTAYNEIQGIPVLAILDSVDSEKYKDSIRLTDYFDFPEYPFKKSWIAEERKFMMAEDTVSQHELDSLKTHPDCMKRVGDLQRIAQTKLSGKKDFVQPAELFHKIAAWSDFECIQNKLKYNNLDGAFYLNLKMLKIFPHNQYLQENVLRCLDILISGLTNHNLNHYLDLPSPFDEKDHKIVVRFLNNLRLSEAQQLKKSFAQKYSLN